MWWRLQPYVTEAATICEGGCSPRGECDLVESDVLEVLAAHEPAQPLAQPGGADLVDRDAQREPGGEGGAEGRLVKGRGGGGEGGA